MEPFVCDIGRAGQSGEYSNGDKDLAGKTLARWRRKQPETLREKLKFHDIIIFCLNALIRTGVVVHLIRNIMIYSELTVGTGDFYEPAAHDSSRTLTRKALFNLLKTSPVTGQTNMNICIVYVVVYVISQLVSIWKILPRTEKVDVKAKNNESAFTRF